MNRKLPSIILDISSGACIFLAIAVLMVPLPWLYSWVMAAAFHEVGHYLAVVSTGGTVYEISIGFSGARMRVSPMNMRREIICAVAGPAAGILLLCIARWNPRIALCGAVQSFYNLLPLYPMDGGRILRCILHRAIPAKANSVLRGVAVMVFAALVFLSVYGFACLRLGLVPLLGCFVILLRMGKRKFPCKEEQLRVQ